MGRMRRAFLKSFLFYSKLKFSNLDKEILINLFQLYKQQKILFINLKITMDSPKKINSKIINLLKDQVLTNKK